MTPVSIPLYEHQRQELQRRCFLTQSTTGLGGIALASLLQRDGAASDHSRTSDHSGISPLATRQPHFTPRAKNVIFLFMAGAPSQLDLFDPKPEMRRLHQQPVPASFLQGLNDSLIKGSARVMASPRTFTRHGQCGMDFSDYLPHMATVADDLCMIRSLHTDTSNHDPAQLLMQCGVPRFGSPSMGSWITYGLGSESQELPGFVVLLSNNGPGDIAGTSLWDSAFLPAPYRGVTFRSQGDPILHLASPEGYTPRRQRNRIAAINDLNRLRLQSQPDPEITSRIEAYELAFRMQTSAPELLDFAQETPSTLDGYGIGKVESDTFGRNCLLARRMVERGVRFVQLYHYTWDDHSDLNTKLKENCDKTDRPVAALIRDLKQRGMLEDTLIIWGGEFGRTPKVTHLPQHYKLPGRDHWGAVQTVFFAGGGTQGGRIVGSSDKIGAYPAADPQKPENMAATIYTALGLPDTATWYDDVNRPTHIFEGAPIAGLF